MRPWRKIAALFRREKLESEMAEELRQHVERRTQRHIAAGMSPDEAHHAASRAFGGAERIKEHCRDERKRGLIWLEQLGRDCGYALRQMRRNPGFTAIITLSLGIGIGANTAIFSLLDALLFRPLPVVAPDELVMLGTEAPGQPGRGFAGFSYPVFRELRERATVFAGMFAHDLLPVNLSVGGQTERILAEEVSGDFFPTLGVGAQVGRVFGPAEDDVPGAHPVVVLSDGFWRRRFGASPDIVGATIRLNGILFTVIGVSRQQFKGVAVGTVPDVRVPVTMDGQLRPPGNLENRGSLWVLIKARLKPGVAREQAQAAADVLFQASREPDVRRLGDSPDARLFKSLRLQLTSAKYGSSKLTSQFAEPLLVLFGLILVVLLVACLNAANLLLARATARQKEIAVRLSLGASRSRLIRQLLTEGMVLSLLGGALGVLFARWGTGALLAFVPQGRIPSVLTVEPDARVLGFTLVVTLLSSVLFGVVPAWQSTRLNLVPALKHEQIALPHAGRRWELRRALVVLQVALSFVLLVGAGLFVRSLHKLKSVDDGYTSDQIVTLALDPAQNGYTPEALRNFYAQLIERVTALPGVKAATLARHLPMSGRYSRFGIAVPGYVPRSEEPMAVFLNQFDPGFFATFGTPLLRGRDFGPQDAPAAPKVVIVNDALARHFFAGEDPIGRRISLEDYKDLEIIGVVADAKYTTLKEAIPLTAYLPYSQYASPVQRTLCVRASGDPGAWVAAIRNLVRERDANLPVFDVRTFAEQIDQSVSRERLVALLSVFFGGCALLLAAMGLYGVMAFAVLQRTREIGIRMALGADRGRVVTMVLRESLLLVGVGLAIGVPTACAVSGTVRRLLFGLTPTDPPTFVFAALTLLIVALGAAAWPARRAAKIDPMAALRAE